MNLDSTLPLNYFITSAFMTSITMTNAVNGSKYEFNRRDLCSYCLVIINKVITINNTSALQSRRYRACGEFGWGDIL